MKEEAHGRFTDTVAWQILKFLPLLIVIGTFLVAWGSLKDRVDFHDQLLQEMRQDIKEILKEIKQQ